MLDNLCSCQYCAGGCEMVDDSSIQGKPCNECNLYHKENEEETI